MQLDRKELHVGLFDMDTDHDALVILLEKGGRICHRASEQCKCKDCPAETLDACCAELKAFARQLSAELTRHFTEEDVQMASLPNTFETYAHCVKHRAEHARFASRYNAFVANLNYGDIVTSVRELESFVAEWIRDHVVKFDAGFAAMLNLVAPGAK